MTCPRCHIEREHGRDKSNPDGRATYCKVCASEIRTAYYAANREKILAQKRVAREKRMEREARNGKPS